MHRALVIKLRFFSEAYTRISYRKSSRRNVRTLDTVLNLFDAKAFKQTIHFYGNPVIDREIKGLFPRLLGGSSEKKVCLSICRFSCGGQRNIGLKNFRSDTSESVTKAFYRARNPMAPSAGLNFRLDFLSQGWVFGANPCTRRRVDRRVIGVGQSNGTIGF